MHIKYRTYPVAIASLILSLSAGQPIAAQTKSLVDGNTAFALDLYARLKPNQGNLFFSPYSISTCLAMTYAGARGNTERQMAEVLHFNRNQGQLNSSFRELQRQLNEARSKKGIELSIANALWAQKGHPFLPAFLDIATSQYDAKVKQADFKTEADSALREINQWVADKTRDKIQDILAPGSLNDYARLVLANAIYFKGIWAKTFEARDTASNPFHISRNRKVDVPLMYHTDKVKYMETDTFQAVELPYTGGELSMVILLPQEIEGCSQLEDALSPRNLSAWLGQMKRQEVDLFVPRFKLESGFGLASVLAAMGMRDAFQTDADFSGIDGTTNLYISSVSHNAWVEVTEEGTEAAAATTVVVATRGIDAEPPRVTFRADHPFIFLIRDTRSGSVLFLGRLVDPTR